MLAHSLQQRPYEADERRRQRRRAATGIPDLPCQHDEHIPMAADLGSEVRVAGDHHASLAFEEVALGNRQQTLAHRQHGLIVRAARLTREQGVGDGRDVQIFIENLGTSGGELR